MVILEIPLTTHKCFINKFCLFDLEEEFRATIKLMQQHWEMEGPLQQI
jgi:hypothetical protein